MPARFARITGADVCGIFIPADHLLVSAMIIPARPITTAEVAFLTDTATLLGLGEWAMATATRISGILAKTTIRIRTDMVMVRVTPCIKTMEHGWERCRNLD